MREGLAFLTGRGHASARASRAEVARLALEERNAVEASAGRPGFASVAEYAAEVARRTLCLTLLAGSGSRWVKSLAAAASLPVGERPSHFDPSFDPALPRGLYRVRDFLGPGAAAGDPAAGRIAIAAYSLAAVKGLGRHVLVVRGHEAEIDREVLSPLGLGPSLRTFFTQDAPFGKPLGHGDATWQCRGFLDDVDYVVTNFGGDANSRLTVLSSLLVLDALAAAAKAGLGPPIDLLLPAARIPSPAYPIGLDAEGLPRSFGHAKLQGVALSGDEGYTNVGLRLYRAASLKARVESFRARYWVDGEGYAIPGNDPSGHEFALDNVDAELASEGCARILATSSPEELTPAKSLEDIPAFEAAIRKVVAEDGSLPA